MFRSALIALKEGNQHDPLITLATRAVLSPAVLHLVTLVRVGTDENEAERLDSVSGVLEKHASRLRDDGYDVHCYSRIAALGPAIDIIRIAEEQSAELVVIGLAKRSRVGKALMGSDAQRILLGAERPVLSVHTEVHS